MLKRTRTNDTNAVAAGLSARLSKRRYVRARFPDAPTRIAWQIESLACGGFYAYTHIDGQIVSAETIEAFAAILTDNGARTVALTYR